MCTAEKVAYCLGTHTTAEAFMIGVEILELASRLMVISQTGLRIQQSRNLALTLKEDQTFVGAADTMIEERIVELLRGFDTAVPILAEEGSGTVDVDLPKAIQSGLFSVDPLDGTFSFSAGLPNWGVSVAFLKHGRPMFAIVAQPALKLNFVAVRGEGVDYFDDVAGGWCSFSRVAATEQKFGLDLARRFVEDNYYWGMARKLILKYNSPRVVPAVSLGVELVTGICKFWIAAHTLKHWDVAATALLTEECGGVAQTLDGNSLPWHEVRMPPLLFAQSQEIADEVRQVVGIE